MQWSLAWAVAAQMRGPVHPTQRTNAEVSFNVCVGPQSGPELTRVERHEVIGPGVYMNVTHRGVGHDATDPSLVAMGHEPRYYLLFAVPLAGKKVDGASVGVL